MRQWIVETMERFNAIPVHEEKSRDIGTTRKAITKPSKPEYGAYRGIAEKKFRNRIRLVGIAGIIIALCGCHITGTIGGTTDLERKHDVSVSITFADGG